jgi:hypothetical protein
MLCDCCADWPAVFPSSGRTISALPRHCPLHFAWYDSALGGDHQTPETSLFCVTRLTIDGAAVLANIQSPCLLSDALPCRCLLHRRCFKVIPSHRLIELFANNFTRSKSTRFPDYNFTGTHSTISLSMTFKAACRIGSSAYLLIAAVLSSFSSLTGSLPNR